MMYLPGSCNPALELVSQMQLADGQVMLLQDTATICISTAANYVVGVLCAGGLPNQAGGCGCPRAARALRCLPPCPILARGCAPSAEGVPSGSSTTSSCRSVPIFNVLTPKSPDAFLPALCHSRLVGSARYLLYWKREQSRPYHGALDMHWASWDDWTGRPHQWAL